MSKYFGGFSSRDSVAEDFEMGTGSRWSKHDPFVPAPDFPTDEEILFASYGGEMYEGDAVVIYRRDEQLFEVRGDHCSCYGLEDQWEPEETDLATLQKRNEVSNYGWHFLDSHDANAEQFAAAVGLTS